MEEEAKRRGEFFFSQISKRRQSTRAIHVKMNLQAPVSRTPVARNLDLRFRLCNVASILASRACSPATADAAIDVSFMCARDSIDHDCLLKQRVSEVNAKQGISQYSLLRSRISEEI